MKISKWTVGNIAGGIAGGLLLGVGIGMMAYGFKFSQVTYDWALPGTLIALCGLTVLLYTAITTSIQVDRHLGKKRDKKLKNASEKWQQDGRKIFDNKL